ncbi:hypothetical protein [Metabacillus sp. 84]|uniref:hypothetical protein n=1 Tax=Metabacillus sp. 84 TaxID=3404705 RepID=UPI003CF9E52F
MRICPLCNGLEEKEPLCRNCRTIMKDHGRTADYLDDYSAYMEIDTMKLFDGDVASLENHLCVHLFFCPVCLHEETQGIQE